MGPCPTQGGAEPEEDMSDTTKCVQEGRHLLTQRHSSRECPVEELHLGQIRDGRGGWDDFARGTESVSRRWQKEEPSDRRVVDALTREILIPALCEAYREHKGMCNAPLTALDDCPYAHEHKEV
jgi:hypothetical protein